MLKLHIIRKTFNPGTVNEKIALDGVNLELKAGDFATIVGSNGAGKSTLFNAITGAFIADEGSIILGGEDITFKPEFQRSRVIGHLFQDPLKGTAPNMTIEENLALAYLRAGRAQRATAEKVLALTSRIVAEQKITCLMVTHNMHQALELGNRTLMMDGGRIVFDVEGEERSRMTVDDLLEKFRQNAGQQLDNDRILLSKTEK